MKIKSAAAFSLFKVLGLAAFFLAPSAEAQLPAFELRPELTGQAVFSCQGLTMSGNSEVDSRGVSTGAAHGTEGHVRSNAGITLSGNVKIYGNAIAGPGSQVVKSGNVAISGTSGPASSPLNCTPIPLAPLETLLLASNNNSQIPRSDKNKVVLGGGSGRVFTLSGNDAVTIPAGNYYFDSLTMSGNSTIRLDGRVNILVKGAISISGGGIVRQLGNTFQLRLWTRGSVAISSQAKFQGFFYAPENAIALSGGAEIEGTLFAKNFAISGTVKIRRSVDDTAPSLSVSAPLEGQSVPGCSVEVAGQASDTEENGLSVKVNGQPVVVTNGQFATTLSLSGADPSLVVVTATDSNGATTQVSRRVTLVPPALTLVSPAPGSLVGQRLIALSGAAGHATALTVDGIAATLTGSNWQIPSFDLGADGAKTLSLSATYCGGAVGASFPLELDTTPPLVEIDGPHGGDLFGSTPVVVTGTIEEAHLASLVVAGIAATVDGGRFTVSVPLAEGLNSLQATALDTLGRSAVSSTVTVELDSIAPAVTIDSPATGSIVGQAQVLVSGHSEDPNLDSVLVNGVAATRSGANFSATLTLTEGDNSLVAIARDRAGNTTSSPAVVVVLDSAPPVVEIAAAELPSLTQEAAVTVIGSARDPHLDAVVVNGVAATLAGESFSAEVPLTEGANSLVATASDVLAATVPGHSASSAPFILVRDSTPPEVTVTEPAEGALLAAGSLTLRGTATDSHLALVTVGGVPVTLAGAAFEAALTLGEGPQTLNVRAVDQLGQATELAIAVIVDTSAPLLEVTSPTEGELVTGDSVTVTGSVTDLQLDTLTVNGELAVVGDNGEFSITIEIDGDTLTVVATDLLGHATEKIVRVSRQSLPPTLSFDPLPGAACSPGGLLATVAGGYADDQSAAPAIVLEVRPPAGAATSYPVAIVPGAAGAGRFSASNVDLGGVDGLVTLVAIATDASGETGRAVATVRVDAIGPTLQLTEGGSPFAGAGAGDAPPAGAAPLVLGRRVAFGAIVTDGAAGAPPAAVLTLDGQPYPAGAPIDAPGNHLLVARATDCAGRTASAYAHFRLDRDAPRLISTNPADGQQLSSGPASFSGVSDADLATATVGGRPATVSGGAFSLAPYPWREGDNRVEIELIDDAGNRASFERSFTVTSAPLTVAIVESGLPIAPGQLFTRPVSPRAVASTSEATVTLSLNGAPFAAGGSVEASGDHTLVATATAGGRSATASVSFRLDTTPPPTIRITAPEEATEIASPTVTVRGTVTGDQVSVTVDGRPATVAGGSFELLAYPLAEQDLLTITATATDRLGRQASSQVTVLHRSAGPWVLILDPADGAVTSRDRIDVAGAVAERPSDLQSPSVRLRGGAGGDFDVPLAADGSFRARDLPLAAGSNRLSAEATDRFGRSGSAAVEVFRDSQPPSITVAANGQPLGEGAIFSSDVALAVTLADDSSSLAEKTVRLNGQLQNLAGGVSFAANLTEEGGYLLAVVARDGAGNESRADRSFLIDRGGCRLAEIFPAAGATVETAAVTLIGRSGAGAAKLKVRLAGAGQQEYDGNLADGTFLVAGLALQMGDNPLELVCTDAAGRVQVTSHLLRRVAAGQGPTIEILSPADGAMLGVDRVAVSGTLSGGEASVNGAAATVAGNQPKTFTLPSLSLAEGPNVIAARAADGGRIATDRIVVWRDTQAPKIVITSPDSGARLGVAGEGPATVDVSGRIELHDEPRLPTVQVSSAAGTVTATVDPATGNFIALALPLAENLPADEAQLLTATATDSLDQKGRATAEVYLDLTGPAIVLSQPADLFRYHENSPAQIAVAGEAWAAPGATVSVNGANLAEAAISWGAPGEDGRRHGQFTAQVALPSRDGGFGIIARVIAADQRYAEARRLLLKDSAAPAVVEILPQDGGTEVDPNTLVLVLFSEPISRASLAGAGGLELIRQSSGQAQAVEYAFAGNAVAVVPSAALLAGEAYQLRAGSAIRDLTGNALAAERSSSFTVASSPLAAAPVLDPLPEVLCAGELIVKGLATSGAEVKVKDGGLLFSGNADAAGRFAVRLPLASSGWHYLSVFAVDPASGIAGPAAGHGVRVDCNAPTVQEARLDRATGVLSLLFSETMDGASLIAAEGGALELRDAEDPDSPFHPATPLEGEGNLFEFQLDPAAEAWWRDRPVRVAVGPPAKDQRGNEMAAVFEQVFFPGGGGLSGGFLYGEAWDDSQGRPLPGATASLYAGAPGASAPLLAVQADGRGRYTFAGQVAAGRYAVLVEKPGFTPVVRWLALEPSQGAVAFDARLTPRGAARGSLDPVAGGRTAESDGLALEATAAALPGSAPLEVSLTALSGQGLPDFLPLGYTPAAAAELRLAAGGVALPEGAAFVLGEVAVELPLPSWVAASDRLVAAQYQLATGRWLALQDPERLSNGRVRTEPLGPGAVAVLVPDTAAAFAPPPVAAFEALEGAPAPAEVPAFSASLALDPPVVAPTGRSLARVVARSQDLATAWPSGLAVQAFLEEKLILAGGGGQLLEAPFVADLLLYHPHLSEAERQGAATGAAGALSFVVSPSPRAAQVLLDVGYEKIRLYPFPEETERGQVVGPTGGTVGDPAEAELTVPEGALSGSAVAEVELLSAAELDELPAVAGYRTLAAVRLGFSGKELARPATLRLPRPAATPDEVAGDPRLILGELVEFPEDQRGTLVRLAARVVRQGSGPGERLVAGPEAEGSLLTLDGIVREGLYLLLHADNPLGFATGLVRGQGSTLLQYARVQAAPLGTADLSRLTGRYAVPVPAGAGRPLEGLHPQTDEKAAAQVTVAAGQVVVADLELLAVPPTIVALQPPDGAQNQPTLTTVAILFSEAIDPASVGGGSLRLELADAEGNGSGVYASGRVTVFGSQLRFESERPLPPGRNWIARFDGGARDLQGTFYAGAAPIEWRFATGTVVVPGGQVDPSKFHVRIPDNGVVDIWADPGALPQAQSGQPAWAVSPYLVGPFLGRDPVRQTYPARTDGGFEGTVGRAGYAATIASRIWVAVLDPTGQVAAEFEVGPLTSADGKAFVARPGEAATFRSAEGLVVDVPAGAFEEPTLVRLSLQPAASVTIATPRGLAIGAVVLLDFDGEAKETLRLHIPAPAGAATGAQVFVGEEKQMPWGPALRFLTYGGVLERGGERFLSNDPAVQAEPDLDAAAGGSQLDPRTAPRLNNKAGAGERNCQEIQAAGNGPCFAEALLPEFTTSRNAIFYHEAGVDWSLISGIAGPIAQSFGFGTEAILNALESTWVFIPRLAHTVADFWILPVVSNEQLTVERRDLATGWVLQSQAYTPIPPGDRDLVLYDPLVGDSVRRPMLVSADPFEMITFAAPPADGRQALRLDIEAVAVAGGQVEIKGVAQLPIAKHTTLALFDLEPIDRDAAPIAGPAYGVCSAQTGWSMGPMAPSDKMMLVVGPGDIEPHGFGGFKFEFDFPLQSVKDKNTDQLAILRDLGPAESCSSPNVAGYPRQLPIELTQEFGNKRLVVKPQGPLSGGHRYQLELIPDGLVSEGADGDTAAQLSYWRSAPTKFAFATREVTGDPIGTMDPGDFPWGGVGTVRGLVRFGNLLLVASDNGRIVAIDTSEPTGEGKLKIHAVSNETLAGVRTFATDGHNRLFYSQLVGSTWVVKAMRVEDARKAAANCQNRPDWASEVPCFDTVTGSVRIATTPGLISSLQFFGAGALPSGMPSDLDLLTQDESGNALDLAAFYETYVGSFAGRQPDADGIYTFDLPLESTLKRYEARRPERSKPNVATPNPRTRAKTCISEEAYDRYQRVTLDNLTTGQSWSLDIENPWPLDVTAAGTGTALLEGVRARKNDRLRLRYNLKTMGYMSITGSGISVIDANRFYRLVQPGGGTAQCGRRLGRYEGADIAFPSCAISGSGPEGIRYTPSLEVHAETGCETGTCRGSSSIDVYSPLLRVGGVHTKSSPTDPGNLQLSEMAACITDVGGLFAQPLDAVLANDVLFLDYGIRGDLRGNFSEPNPPKEPIERRRDLLFLAIGQGGVFVFDVSERKLAVSNLVGHFMIKDRIALRMTYDPVRGLLLIGGTDNSSPGNSRPVIDLWDVRHANAAPGTRHLPASLATIFAPTAGRGIAFDSGGTGLIYSWDPDKGPIVLPVDRPKFTFAGLYVDKEAEPPAPGQRLAAAEQATSVFVPLGVPMEVKPADDKANAFENEKKGTAAFKLRIALPGSFGETLLAKVQSLRALPPDNLLGEAKVGEAVALPGGTGWPDQQVTVKLRRVGAAAGTPAGAGESGPLGAAYNLYESVETLLLIADPRAGREYRRQDAEGEADEKGQCRRCAWPTYLPDPEVASAQELDKVKEILAGGRYLRAFLHAETGVDETARLATEAAIAFFQGEAANYPLPGGWVKVAAPADGVPSPIQAALAEPAQNAASFSPGEMGISVALAGGDLQHATTDHAVAGRGLSFSFDRSYRSLWQGYGPLGNSGWTAGLFAHLREIETTGEIEYHDGRGQVWRFFPSNGQDPGEGWERDDSNDPDQGSSYFVPSGLYLRLQKLRNREGWRLIGRDNSVAEFDEAGRLWLLSDRIRKAKKVGEQGNTLELRYDAFGKLTSLFDDLGRRYDFEYFDDPQFDTVFYGLLKSIKDFAGREVVYDYDVNRRLTEVRLPEVKNTVGDYAQHSYEGEQRPTIRYEYLGTRATLAPTALAHGELGKNRLEAIKLPRFGSFDTPRVRFAYDSATGRVKTIGFPTPGNQNADGGSVAWQLDYSDTAAPATEATITAPWGHATTYSLEEGRTREVKQQLEVVATNGNASAQEVKTAFTYLEDGRLETVTHPDGGEDQLTYQTGASLDRLSLPNVVQATRKAPEGGRGEAIYGQIVTQASYKDGNQLSKIIDGLSRATRVGVPLANEKAETVYEAEQVRHSQQIDAYGRVTEQVGGAGLQKSVVSFGKDARDKEDAGLMERITVGQMSTSFDRDDAGNVERVDTAQQIGADLLYDEWDRVIRSVSGLSTGDYAPVGSGFCATAGARTERAFDAAGHLIRERSLQDFVDAGGLGCRWVETFYTYNAREQVVEVRQTHLSDPGQAGAVSSAAKLVGSAVFDDYGRLKESHALNQVDSAVVTHYRYDAAGRSVGVKVGETAERVQGFDAKNRVVYRSDGHQAVWRGRFDAWDRIWIEQQPTGAWEQHTYDQANNLTETTVWDRDPKADSDPENPKVLLKDTRTKFNSFGEIERVVEELTTGAGAQKRVTERKFDSAGRVTRVASGPSGVGDDLDPSQARREKEIGYEEETGRVLYEASGGLVNDPPLFERRFLYEPKTSWPHRVLFFEKVPGTNVLTETQSSRFDYDALGRVIKEERNDGSKVETIYDRLSGQPIQVTTGAGAVSTVSYDSAGRQVRTTRPNNRGETLYAYDLDGRLRQQVTKTESTDWATSYGYDAVGRPIRVDYQDGSFATTTWNSDSTVATRRTRDGLTLTYTYDAANRPVSVVPSGTVAATLEPLDAGDETSWDALSRPTSQRRAGNAGLTVAYPSYDVGGRPAEEKVGQREALGWAWDIYNQPIETRLPIGIGRSAGSFTGFQRQFNTLDQLVGIGALGGEPQSVDLGATWSLGGSGRLWGMTTKGSLGTAVRFGYLGGSGAQPPAGNSGDSKWKLGTMTWGSMPHADPESTATQTPTPIWGQFAFGYRGNEGDPRDGAKVGRLAVKAGRDLFAGAGWSWNYDAGVRLSEATGGRGDMSGANPDNDPSFHYRYGKGDELQQIVDEASGKVAGIETGAYGRITKRNGIPFSYDSAGRRTEDDRFEYKWNWRGELMEVTVKASWPDGQESPFAGHQVRYQYDAQGRLHSRSHYGPLEGQGGRLLQGKRVYLWEGQSLLVEAAYADEAEALLQWRKTHIPGPSGLDDAVQVKVDNIAAPGIAGSRLYTYLRDELGTVIGVVGEEEINDPANPNLPARYLYSPYGEAHIEKALEIRRVRFEESEDRLGSQSQEIEDPDEQSKGALIVTFAASLDASSLAAGVVVEVYNGVEWVALGAQELLVGYDDATELKVLAREGWGRGASYRVRLTTALKDKQGRNLAKAQTFEWRIAASGASSDFSRSVAVEYETAKASLDTLGGRFPGGQNNLFQGLWSDPVTGISYARARWYDGRNAGWLSEDPLQDVDSSNRYAFVGWSPAMGRDPLGKCRWDDWECLKWTGQAFGSNVTTDPNVSGTLKVLGGTLEIAAGAAGLAAPEPTLVTKVAGWAAVVHGSDVVSSGFLELIMQEQMETLTQQAATWTAESMGASDETAGTIGFYVDVLASAGPTMQCMRASTGLAARSTPVLVRVDAIVARNYELSPMGSYYRRFDIDNGVQYLDEVARQDYLVRFENGKLVSKTGRLFDSHRYRTEFSDGRMIYVMAPDGEVYISATHRVGEFHHSSFLSGGPVAAAGEMEISEGVVTYINRVSGHYHPNIKQLDQIRIELEARGLDVSKIRFDPELPHD